LELCVIGFDFIVVGFDFFLAVVLLGMGDSTIGDDVVSQHPDLQSCVVDAIAVNDSTNIMPVKHVNNESVDVEAFIIYLALLGVG